MISKDEVKHIAELARLGLTETEIKKFQNTIWRYYERHKRDMPWRKTTDPYRILVSEIMLQQTQVGRVIPKYNVFVDNFPTVEMLARAPLRKVLKLWSGLGYNRRALSLHAAAQEIVKKYKGLLPNNVLLLDALPGIGKATASALVTFAVQVCGRTRPSAVSSIKNTIRQDGFTLPDRMSSKNSATSCSGVQGFSTLRSGIGTTLRPKTICSSLGSLRLFMKLGT